MGLHHSPSAVSSGLILCLDARNPRSYTGTGTTWADAASNGFNGTLLNSPTYNSSNGHFTFTHASNQQVTFSNLPQLQFLNRAQYSFECWLRVNTIPGNSTWRRIFNREGNPGSGRDGYNFLIDSSVDGTNISFGTERFVAGSAVQIYQTVPYSTNGNGWNQWCVTYDGLRLSLYRNGSLFSSSPDTRSITNTVTTLSLMGMGGTTSAGGDLSLFKVYNVALSTDSIRQNFNALRSRYGV